MGAPILYVSELRLLFIGRPLVAQYHAMPVARLLLCLQGELLYRFSPHSDWRTCTSLLLPPCLTPEFQCNNILIADLYLDVGGYDYGVLRQQAHRREYGAYSEIRDEQALREKLIKVFAEPPSAEQLWLELEQLISPQDLVQSMFYQSDPRIDRIIKRIRQSVRDNLSAESLAEEVGLSASRLLSLFKQQTGLPIRRYRLWWRLHYALVLIAKGRSLTEAAIYTGFADSSHFSRSFTEMIGFAPSVLTRQTHALKFFVTPSWADHPI